VLAISVQRVDTQSEHGLRVAVPTVDRVPDGAAALCSCTATSLSSPAGEIIIALQIAGEADLSTVPVLQAALADSLARRPRHLVVDLAGLTFCSAGGHTLLVGAGRTAGGQGTGYAVTGVSGLVIRLWMLVWPAGDLPIRYPTARRG
jgi:anti-sigma B factor antagonist